MKKGQLKMVGIGIYTLIKASIPIEAHCPTISKNYLEKTLNNEYKQSDVSDTINLIRYSNYLNLWEKN